MGLGQESDREGEVVSGELGSRFVGTWTCRDEPATKKALSSAAIAQNCGREGLHIMTACIRSVHEDSSTQAGLGFEVAAPIQEPPIKGTGFVFYRAGGKRKRKETYALALARRHRPSPRHLVR